MALPVYPAELPPPTRSGYQAALGDGRIRSPNGAAIPNIRGRFTNVADSVSFSTLLSRAQRGRFEQFYQEDTKRGSLPWILPSPDTDGWYWLDEDENVLTDETGTPLLITAPWVVLFDELPQWQPNDIYWTVNFKLSVLP